MNQDPCTNNTKKEEKGKERCFRSKANVSKYIKNINI